MLRDVTIFKFYKLLYFKENLFSLWNTARLFSYIESIYCQEETVKI